MLSDNMSVVLFVTVLSCSRQGVTLMFSCCFAGVQKVLWARGASSKIWKVHIYVSVETVETGCEVVECVYMLTLCSSLSTATRQRVMLETASIAGGATIAVFLVVIVCISLYIHYHRKLKEKRVTATDATDGRARDLELRPFSRCLSIPMDRLDEVSVVYVHNLSILGSITSHPSLSSLSPGTSKETNI
jgi:keren protein